MVKDESNNISVLVKICFIVHLLSRRCSYIYVHISNKHSRRLIIIFVTKCAAYTSTYVPYDSFFFLSFFFFFFFF